MTASSRSMELEFTKLAPPRIFLVRMVVFLVLCALIMVVLYKQIVTAFFANPGLNALIGLVLLVGII
ncbi:MAG: flagellar motor protein MotA, partial [Bradyrhizobium sp.]